MRASNSVVNWSDSQHFKFTVFTIHSSDNSENSRGEVRGMRRRDASPSIVSCCSGRAITPMCRCYRAAPWEPRTATRGARAFLPGKRPCFSTSRRGSPYAAPWALRGMTGTWE